MDRSKYNTGLKGKLIEDYPQPPQLKSQMGGKVMGNQKPEWLKNLEEQEERFLYSIERWIDYSPNLTGWVTGAVIFGLMGATILLAVATKGQPFDRPRVDEPQKNKNGPVDTLADPNFYPQATNEAAVKRPQPILQ